MEPDQKETDATQLLEISVPSLLSEKRNEAFLVNLFASERGEWQRVAELCRDIPGSAEFFNQLAPLITRDLLVVWLAHPSREGEYAYIHFYLEDYFWTKSAIFNLHVLRKPNHSVERFEPDS